jgi:hypothetical protein
MNNIVFHRTLYKTILNLHPAPFRERFSQEMLWIFDETVLDAGASRMVADVFSSLVKQWLATDTVPQPAAYPFQFAPARSISVTNIAQASAIAFLAVLGFFALLQQAVPLPQPPKTFEVRRAPLPDICEESKTKFSRHTH